MKKTILFLSAFALTISVSGQVLESENFNALTVGDVGTVFDASAPGQGNFLTFANNGTATANASTNAGNSNFQIASAGPGNNVFNLTSPNAVGGVRFMWKDGGLGTQWSSRTAGNDVIEIEYTFDTGAATTSRGNLGVRLYSAAGNAIIGFGYNTDTRVLSGLAYLNNGGTPGTFNINLATGGLVLNQNTSYRIGCSYNTTTGEVLWKTDPAVGSSGLGAAFWIPNQTPDELDFVAFANAANPSATPPTVDNTSAATISFEGYSVEAVVTSDLLTTGEESLNDVTVNVYPNPATDVLNITSSAQQFTSVNIVDLNGRLVKSFEVESNVVNANIQDLKSGLYIVNISNNETTISRKFIKE
ncbi:MAG: T9SS type A sorting domain-containing protein [Nonlabens sp.]|uniref:T9SS type A sorting domain-containing protein n=1 Tax=Nonlabens sp. TaxID=1888209 RepID=UPI00321C3637